MWKITNNYRCWITKDGEHFAIQNIPENSVDGGYKLGEFAEVKDGSKKYLVTINKDEIFESQEVAS